jgi:hypothetical protein
LVLKITRPVAGETIASRWAVVTLGGKMPLEVDLISSMADGSGWVPSELMPTWAYITKEQAMQQTSAVSFFMIANYRVCK